MKPANLEKLLEAELVKMRALCDKLENGRTQLAEFLGIRLSEVSRYLAQPAGRKPSGPVLAGMRAFHWKHTRKAARPTIKLHVFEGERPSEIRCGCGAVQVLPDLHLMPSGKRNPAYWHVRSKFEKEHAAHAKK